jgi:hypothetical protein
MKLLRISFLGLDAWETNFIRAAIDIAAGTDIAQWSVEDSPEQADLLLIRPDVPAGASALQRHTHASRPLVVLCAEADSVDATAQHRVLARPVRYPDLIAVLREAQAKLHSMPAAAQAPAATTPASAVTQPAMPASPAQPSSPSPSAAPTPAAAPAATPAPIPVVLRTEPVRLVIVPAARGNTVTVNGAVPHADSEQPHNADRPTRRFLPNTRLLGLIQRAVSLGEATEFAHPDYPPLTVLPGDDCYLCAADPATLQGMFRTPAWAFTSKKPDPANLRAAGKQGQRPLWRLMYFAALFGSEGHLAGHAALEDRLRLVDEPDLSSLHPEPSHTRIIEFLRDHVADVAQIAQAANASLESVVSFCTACEFAGFIYRVPAGQEPDLGESALRRRVNDMLMRLRGLFV